MPGKQRGAQADVYYLDAEQSSRMCLGEKRAHSLCGRSITFTPVRFTGGIVVCPAHGEINFSDTFQVKKDDGLTRSENHALRYSKWE
ncbi:MAG: hypothetical protein ACTSX8_03555 [Alphaproteobacteria bacterium]